MATTTWYYFDTNDDKQGPVTGGQLKWLAKNGKITPETMVETEDGKKAPARKVKGLTFSTPGATPSATAPPEPAQPVEAEIYGVATSPPKPNPFTASMPKAVSAPSAAPSPFIQTMPPSKKPEQESFKIRLDGQSISVTKNQLFDLARRGSVLPSDLVTVAGAKVFADSIEGIVFGDKSSAPPPTNQVMPQIALNNPIPICIGLGIMVGFVFLGIRTAFPYSMQAPIVAVGIYVLGLGGTIWLGKYTGRGYNGIWWSYVMAAGLVIWVGGYFGGGGGKSVDSNTPVHVESLWRDELMKSAEESTRLSRQGSEITERMLRREISPDEASRQLREIERRMQQLSR